MRRIARTVVWLIALCVLANGCAWYGKARSATELDGTWDLQVSDAPAFALTVTFSGSAWECHWGAAESRATARGTLTLRRDVDPKQVDLLIAEHPDAQLVGKSTLGIYKVQDGELTLAANEAGAATRPISFQREGSMFVFVGKRSRE